MMHKLGFLGPLVIGVVIFTASVAGAQTADPAAPAAPASAAPAPGAPAPAPAGEEESPARFRWGISAIGGPYLYSGQSGGLGGVDVRLGVQLNRDMAVYGQPIFLVGAGVSSGAAGASASALAVYGAGALFDYTLADMVYLAIGPEFLAGGTGASSTVGGVKAEGSAGAFFSVAARAGIALSSKNPQRRKAFTIGLDFHSVFVSGGPLIIPGIALGYESF